MIPLRRGASVRIALLLFLIQKSFTNSFRITCQSV
nr:MAG TPA: hypothetical protein [Caudoviricetes sp.]